MVLTQSSMPSLGTQAPDFSLLDPSTGERCSRDDLRGARVTVIIFMCNHCPYVIHIKEALKELASDFGSEDIAFIGINANDPVSHPDDAPEKMADEGYPFIYLFDESQDVARAYGAQCTPDIFVYDEDMSLVYRGQFDESRPGSGEATGDDLRNAIELALAGDVIEEQYPSSGCNIKWKA